MDVVEIPAISVSSAGDPPELKKDACDIGF